ncbi:hypothetical protein [Actinophytocola oryzae]|uniref:hypothetical protein n=1 Tax=Actinophytocola oryzae TaxID=502181 RepID=UPI00312C738E
MRLVDIPGSANKAVQSTSTMQVANVKLLAGTPFEIQIRVVSQPTLQVTSTGDESTSNVAYTAPVLAVEQGGRSLGQLDAAHPKLDIPVGIPLAAGAPNLPIIGDLLSNGQQATAALQRLDLGVIRLGVAQLDQRGMAMTAPFKGFQLGATARMLDLQVLPTQALGLPNLPSALAQVALGEQVARAYAPAGGVVCRTSEQPPPPPTPKPQGRAPMELAYTTMAYKTIPLFWTGTAMLLIGVVLVAALPRLRVLVPVGPDESGEPRDGTDEGPVDEADTADASAPDSESETPDAAEEDPATGPADAADTGADADEADAGGAEADAGSDGAHAANTQVDASGAEAHATDADTDTEADARAADTEVDDTEVDDTEVEASGADAADTRVEARAADTEVDAEVTDAREADEDRRRS